MAGAKRGKPKPARERRKETAASAAEMKIYQPPKRALDCIEKLVVPDAACRVNASMTYVWMVWNERIRPAPVNAIPY